MTTPPTSTPTRSGARSLRRLSRFLQLGVAGLALLLTGLVWDAVLHARNPELGHTEGLFTVANPGHPLLGAGILGVAVGVAGAAWVRLGMSGDPGRVRTTRGVLLLTCALATALSLSTLGWAANEESAAMARAGGHDHGAGGHDHGTGACHPSAGELAGAARLTAGTARGVARYRALETALATGYAPHHDGRELVKHYFNASFVQDGLVLDPTRPEGLMYARTDRGPVLVAAVYLMNQPGERGMAVGGCLTAWHEHDNLCSSNPAMGVIDGVRSRSGRCPQGQVAFASPPMLHTWIIDVPGGPFTGDVPPAGVLARLGSGRARASAAGG
ncbi:MAG TPA: hypothetical protein VKG45_10705 [Actinomycetes bacterium]|nr:hypothetical protein [Actinomycetes bacterium]